MPDQRRIRRQKPARDLDEFLGFLAKLEAIFGPVKKPAQINRGTITVTGDAGFVFNGNINFDPRTGMLAEHLFKPLPVAVRLVVPVIAVLPITMLEFEPVSRMVRSPAVMVPVAGRCVGSVD